VRKKHIVSSFAALALTLVFAACADAEAERGYAEEDRAGGAPSVSAELSESAEPKTPDEEEPVSPAQAYAESETRGTPPEETVRALDIQPVSAEDFRLLGFAAHQNISDVINALGDDYAYSEAISCDHDGLDKVYIYDGVEFYTYPNGESDLISEIILTSDKHKTPAGVSVRDSKNAVTAIYGDDFITEGAAIVYKSDASELWFYISENAVEYISLAKLAGE
jgi:hypothetical protein